MTDSSTTTTIAHNEHDADDYHFADQGLNGTTPTAFVILQPEFPSKETTTVTTRGDDSTTTTTPGVTMVKAPTPAATTPPPPVSDNSTEEEDEEEDEANETDPSTTAKASSAASPLLTVTEKQTDAASSLLTTAGVKASSPSQDDELRSELAKAVELMAKKVDEAVPSKADASTSITAPKDTHGLTQASGRIDATWSLPELAKAVAAFQQNPQAVPSKADASVAMNAPVQVASKAPIQIDPASSLLAAIGAPATAETLASAPYQNVQLRADVAAALATFQNPQASAPVQRDALALLQSSFQAPSETLASAPYQNVQLRADVAAALAAFQQNPQAPAPVQRDVLSLMQSSVQAPRPAEANAMASSPSQGEQLQQDLDTGVAVVDGSGEEVPYEADAPIAMNARDQEDPYALVQSSVEAPMQVKALVQGDDSSLQSTTAGVPPKSKNTASAASEAEQLKAELAKTMALLQDKSEVADTEAVASLTPILALLQSNAQAPAQVDSKAPVQSNVALSLLTTAAAPAKVTVPTVSQSRLQAVDDTKNPKSVSQTETGSLLNQAENNLLENLQSFVGQHDAKERDVTSDDQAQASSSAIPKVGRPSLLDAALNSADIALGNAGLPAGAKPETAATAMSKVEGPALFDAPPQNSAASAPAGNADAIIKAQASLLKALVQSGSIGLAKVPQAL